MKKHLIKSMIILGLVAAGCCSPVQIFCDECDDIQQGAELADLLLDEFDTQQSTDSSGSVVYDVIQTVINFAKDFECEDEVAQADPHTDQLQLIFSSDSTFNNPSVVGTQETAIAVATGPNKRYGVNNQIQFGVAGFYKLTNSIDHNNEVNERDETNNVEDRNPLGTRVAYDADKIIHITEEMIKTKSNQHILRWDVTVEYLD